VKNLREKQLLARWKGLLLLHNRSTARREGVSRSDSRVI
jgi:hypothetical protein